MKKHLLLVAVLFCSMFDAVSQGTINPLNGALTRVKVDLNQDGVGDRNATVADGVTVSVFWGPAGTIPENLLGRMTIGSTDGVLVGLPSILAVPGAGDAGTIISLEMTATDASGRFDRTGIKQIALAPAAGPGTVVWGSSVSVSRFSPLVLRPIPEPAVLALGVFAGATLLVFRRLR